MPASDKELRAAFDALRDVLVRAFEALDAQPTPPPPDPKPEPDPAPSKLHPSDVLDLRNWTIMLPTGGQGDPDNEYVIDKTIPGVLFVDPADGAVVFRARCDGVHSTNSHYPRTEMRQMRDADWTKAAWSNATTGSTLEVDEAITHTPVVKPEVVAAQIHDGGDDVIQIHLSGTRLTVRYADGEKSVVLDEDYQLGARFTVRIVAAGKRVKVFYNGQQKADLALTGTGWYWKIGAYVQSNTEKGDKPDAYGEVKVWRYTVA